MPSHYKQATPTGFEAQQKPPSASHFTLMWAAQFGTSFDMGDRSIVHAPRINVHCIRGFLVAGWGQFTKEAKTSSIAMKQGKLCATIIRTCAVLRGFLAGAWSGSVWSAWSLLPLSSVAGQRKREQAPRTPYASRGSVAALPLCGVCPAVGSVIHK